MSKTVKATIQRRKAALKERLAKRRKATKAKFGMEAVAVAALLCTIFAGCAIERADPAARSNRATYTISVVAEGGSTATAYITDGLMATADGEGAVTQPSTFTTTQNPDLSGGLGGISPVAAGIHAAASLGGKAIDAYAARQNAKAAESSTAAKSTKGCADGSCSLDGSDCADCTIKGAAK